MLGQIKRRKLYIQFIREYFCDYPCCQSTRLYHCSNCEGTGQNTKKTELIRAGIQALATMPDAEFLAAVRAISSLKTG
jgi:hypothetical protein